MFFSAKTTCKTILRFSPCLDKETLKKQFHVMLVQIHSPEAFKLGLKSGWCEEFVSYWSAKLGAAFAATIHGAFFLIGTDFSLRRVRSQGGEEQQGWVQS